ncbi:MAG: tetratricopeptide repeat protein [Azoarcus sp.]|jgi:tetratricopeptide (TPR) repeat protein|nr:tetratricopeptide repeat protein [Azoarcus sp.]
MQMQKYLFHITIAVLATVLGSTVGWCQNGDVSGPGDSDVAMQQISDDEAAMQQTFDEGTLLVHSGKFTEAIQQFDKVIASYEEKFRDKKTRFFCARSSTESLAYLLEVASAKAGGAKVLSMNWAYAYYLKSYALLELGRLSDVKANLERALALSPHNSQFLSELGNFYQRERNWPKALQTFQRAEAAAEFSPPDVKNSDLSRAWRGIGFVYVEQKRLDEAEKIYQRCLELDKNDTKAASELRYVQDLMKR